jgi:hypothetical protein
MKEIGLKNSTLTAQFIGKKFVVLAIMSLILVPLGVGAQDAITFPPLTGEYLVGQTELYFIDQTRLEIFTDDPDDVRELMTTVFYPAATTGEALPAPYGNDELKAEASTWPGIDAESWSLIDTPLASEVPFAPEPQTFPVILFSPGLGTPPLYYTSLLAEIASHGYIVVSISRTYTTALTVFPDGRVIRSNEAGTDVDGREGETYFDVQARRAEIGAVWVADIQFVLDQLEGLNQEDGLLGGHLDMDQIGLIGHSFGGSASAQTAYLDNRIGAVVDMDSHLDGEVAFEGLSQPYLFMEEAYQEYEDPNKVPGDEQLTAMGITRDDLFNNILVRVNHINLLEASSAGYRLRLEGAQHLTFATDLHVFAPHFPSRINQGQVGTIEGEHALQIIEEFTVAFFDQYLKDEESPLLKGEFPADPDVIFETF